MSAGGKEERKVGFQAIGGIGGIKSIPKLGRTEESYAEAVAGRQWARQGGARLLPARVSRGWGRSGLGCRSRSRRAAVPGLEAASTAANKAEKQRGSSDARETAMPAAAC